LPAALDTPRPPDFGPSARLQSEVPADFTFLSGLRQRVPLAETGLGPRAIAVVGGTGYVANYFSDTLAAVTLSRSNSRVETVALGPKADGGAVRAGELCFHDARLCYQGWQSCASCHPGDARMDGLNWDLLNDDRGNPKSTRSLLLAHRTPPAMSLGVRETAETAVRAGLEHVLFTRQPEEVPAAMDRYLKSLKPVPSPFLVEGRLSEPAGRGRLIFERAGCADCHPPGLYTDLRSYDVGTRVRGDQPDDEFDTPTLVELWRTAPYLHDGSAATVREVITSRNPRDEHGVTSKLSEREIEDLLAFLLSL
jgi:cytochrome c peroxidase